MKDNKLSLTDQKVDVEELQKKIADLINENEFLKKQKKFGLAGEEKFGLVWEEKPDAQVLRVRNESPMLCEEPLKAVVGDTTATNHILINGDNFHALTALRPTHAGKVDVIYIDPPYNTGNKDFIYNDNFLDKEDNYRHSKWLSFMEKRLTLAKELLSETGVIFVSIDDNEQAQLKLLMDEVFGAKNLIANMIWKSGGGVGQDSRYLSNSLEYILLYAKNKPLCSLNGIAINESDFKLQDEYFDQRGGYKINGLDRGSLDYTKSLDFIITDPSTGKEYRAGSVSEIERQERIENTLPRKDWRWRWSQDKVKWGIENEFILFKNNKVYFKQYALVDNTDTRVTKSNPYSTFIDGISTLAGTKILKAVLGDGFNYPKPVELIKHLCRMASSKDSIILDFFAGSGTTAHAIAELNKEDGGSRQCILVTDGGKTEITGESAKNAKGDTVNIAEEITYERVRRVLTGKDWADKKEHEPLGGNLRYFKVVMEQSPHGATETDRRLTLEKYTIEHAKITENIFDMIASENHFDDETLINIDYKVFAAEAEGRYLVGVNSHDYALSNLEIWFAGLPMTAKVTMVGNGLEKINWVKNNSERIQLDDVLGRAIRSRTLVASNLPLG